MWEKVREEEKTYGMLRKSRSKESVAVYCNKCG